MHTSIHSEPPEITRQSRTQWFTAYTALSPVIGLLTPSFAKKLRQLDAGTEASGPHVFAVRVGIARQARRHVHRPPPRVRDVASRPSEWNRMAGDIEVIWVGRQE